MISPKYYLMYRRFKSLVYGIRRLFYFSILESRNVGVLRILSSLGIGFFEVSVASISHV